MALKCSLLVLVILLALNTASSFSLFHDESEKSSSADRGTWVIALDDADAENNVNEHEMIQPESLGIEIFVEDETKYGPLHAYVARSTNQRTLESANKVPNGVAETLAENVFRSRQLKLISSGGAHEATADTGTVEMGAVETAKIDFFGDSPIATEQPVGIRRRHIRLRRKTTQATIATLADSTKVTAKEYRDYDGHGYLSSYRVTPALVHSIRRRELTVHETRSPNFGVTRAKSTVADVPGKLTSNPAQPESTGDGDGFEKIVPDYGVEIHNDVKPDNFTFNFTDDEIHKSLKNIVKNALDLKKPRNCSTFEGFKYGFQALECAIASRATGKIWKIVKFWLCVYAFFAIPCWCHKGWCCCCFRCKFCFPSKIIIKEKKYLVENPPGVLIDRTKKSAETLKYKPTIFEKDAYERLESAMRDL